MPRHGLHHPWFLVMQAQQRVGQPCWRYWFDYVAEASMTPTRMRPGMATVPTVFDNLRLTDPVRQYASEADLAFAAQVADYWTRLRLASGERAARRSARPAGVPARGGIACCALACISARV
ncbi:hypothetical protein MJ575_16310 [Klebsiella pneumoniae]|nr:hypothetical protein MJ575_16310 [Klebsiella pneumoniae]